jgi:hypothetical protein
MTFVRYLATLPVDYIDGNGSMEDEWWTGKDLEERGNGVIEVYAWRDWENHEKPVRIPGVPAGIRASISRIQV